MVGSRLLFAPYAITEGPMLAGYCRIIVTSMKLGTFTLCCAITLFKNTFFKAIRMFLTKYPDNNIPNVRHLAEK